MTMKKLSIVLAITLALTLIIAGPVAAKQFSWVSAPVALVASIIPMEGV